MLNRLFLTLVVLLLFLVSISFGFRADTKDQSADEKAIREHIDKIFRAYIAKDRDTVKATHSKNWRGFLSNSREVIRGIDGYMSVADGQGSFNKENPWHLVDYKMQDYDVV